MSSASAQQGKPNYAASVRSGSTQPKQKSNGTPQPKAPPPVTPASAPPTTAGAAAAAAPQAATAGATPASQRPRNDPFGGFMHDRLLYATMCLLGQKVEVRVTDGSVVEGIFHTATTEEGGFGVVLRLANFKFGPGGQPFGAQSDDPAILFVQQTPKTIVIPPGEFVSMTAFAVDFSQVDRLSGVVDSDSSGGFKTDTGISGFSGNLKERELVAWTPDPDVASSLEDDLSSSSGKQWDQFAANQKLFGVKTTFNEELYTTKLNRNSPDFKKNEKEAERIASEIMRQTSSNYHLLEERGQEVELDEEALYGAVIRDKQQIVTPKPKQESASPAASPAPSPAATTSTSPAPRGPGAGGVYRPPQMRQDSPQPYSPKQGSPQPSPTSTAGAATQTPSGTQASGEKRSSISLPPTIMNSASGDLTLKPVEEVLPDIQRDLQKFSQQEKEKVIQRKQSLREEKSAEMKQFSQNLKLPASQPTEPSSSSPTAPAAANAAAPAPAATSDNKSQQQPPSSTTTTTTASTGTPPTKEGTPENAAKPKEKKLDPKAKEFVFNPGATVFTPSSFVAPAPVKKDFFTPEKRRDINSGAPLAAPFHVVSAEADSEESASAENLDAPQSWQPKGEQPALYQVVSGEEFYPQPYVMVQAPMFQPYPPRFTPVPFVPYYPSYPAAASIRGMAPAMVPPPYYIDPQGMQTQPPMQMSTRPPRFNQGRPHNNNPPPSE